MSSFVGGMAASEAAPVATRGDNRRVIRIFYLMARAGEAEEINLAASSPNGAEGETN